LLLGLIDVIITVCVGYFIFKVPFRGSFIQLYLMAMLFLVGTSGMGILISAITRMQVLSVQIAMIVTYLPSILLSGFIFPIQNMPVFLQGFTHLIPARYMIVLVKGIVLKGISCVLLWTQIAFLGVF